MYSVTYELPTANGFTTRHTVKTDTIDETKEVCEAVVFNGYKLIDVTNEPIDELKQ